MSWRGKHTPRPWRLGSFSARTGRTVQHVHGGPSGDSVTVVICEAGGEHRPPQDFHTCQANAELCAAAPDLADVLERIVRTAYEDRGSEDAYHGDDFDPLFREAADLLGLDLDELADVEPDEDEDDDEDPPPSTADTCEEPARVTCGGCRRSWCERCDPGPSALCPWCHGRGYSTAEVRP